MSARVQLDREARWRAQTVFDRPLLLEAGAGTGKTAVLVARVVAWCLGKGWEDALAARRASPQDPQAVAASVVRRVVAITFTEAAAAEMATRVAEALLRVQAGGELPPGLDEDALPASDAARRARAEALVGVLDQLPVRTIHAWCRKLLVEHPFEAGLHPGFEVDADGQVAAAVAREVLEAHLPRAFDDPPDRDFAELLLAGIGPGDVEAALARLVSEGARPEDLADDPLAPARIAAFGDALADALAAMVRHEGGRVAALGGAASRMSGLAEALAELEAAARRRPLLDRDALEGWLTLLDERLEDGHRAALQRIARGDPGSRVAQAMGDACDSWCEAAARLRPLLEHARRLRLAQLDAARRVLGSLLEDAVRRMRARGVEGFGGLLRGARDLLVGHPSTAAAVRAGIDQLLVDEFQDTDAMQCELLAALALTGGGARPTLFLVGDPKQSIYGWRNADLRAYDAFKERVVDVGGEVAPLVVNHRSVPAILHEVERLVRPVMHEAPGLQPPFERLEPCDRLAGEEGFREAGRAPVEHWLAQVPGDGDDARADPTRREASEIEARAVARDLRALRDRGVSLGRVGLLLRATSDFETYLAALRDAGIRFVVERETRHYERREVVDAMALVRCVLDPHDHLALVATLRSAVVGVPDAALVPLWARRFPEAVAELDGAEPARLERLKAIVDEAAGATPTGLPGLAELGDFRASLQAFLATLDALRALHETAPAEDFVEALRSWALPEATEAARYLGSYRTANLDRFFRELVEALESSGGSASAVVAHLRRAGSLEREHEEGRPRAIDDDAVQVMTIHRAKGLAFDHVYLLQTHKGSGGGGERRTQVVRHGGGTELVLLDAPSPGLVFADRQQAEVDACERVRLLYVAATRARARLVVSGLRTLGAPVRIENVRSHADLLSWREATPVDLEAGLAEVAAAGQPDLRDADGVRWCLPALAAEGDDAEAALDAASAAAPPAAAEADERELAACRAIAERRAARPVSRAASEEEAWGEARAARVVDEAPPTPSDAGREAWRRIALAAGTAVHEALETLDPERPDPERAGRALATALLGLGEEERRAATARATSVLARFLDGPLAARLRALAPHVVARELPVLLPPGEGSEEPVGFWSGAIDLLYRDPESGELVVADYKTDAVEGEALRARADAYAGQGRVYVRAVQEALGLPEPPRFELWFLQAGEVVTA